MGFVGRTRELGALRSALDLPEAAVHSVTGIRGAGKTALVRRVTGPLPGLYHRAPPLPDPDHRGLLATALGPALSGGPAREPLAPHPSWSELFEALVDATPPGGRGRVVMLDDVHRLAEARSRYVTPLVAAMARARAEGRRLHVVLVGPAHGMPPAADLQDAAGEEVRLGPLAFRAAARLLPASSPRELLRSYAVFGGIPAALVRLDPDLAFDTNLRRAIFDEGAPLGGWGLELLERDVQTPSRYVAILSALAEGEAGWGRVHAGVGDLSTSGQVAPYLKKLEELGLVEVRRSLDSGPRSRSRRYRITDPFVAFWYRFVLGHRHDPRPDERGDYVAEIVRPALDQHAATVFPEVCRQYMTFDAMEVLAANARECGGLWGEGYDMPVAGTLGTGAVFYGLPVWSKPPARARPLQRLDEQIRETRYGFGRERRLRILFTAHGVTRALEREATRRDDTMLLGAEQLAGVE